MGLGVVLHFLATARVNGQTSTYSVIDLGAMVITAAPTGAGGLTFAGSVNNSGLSVGRAGYDTGANTRAVLWTLASRTNLGTLPGGDYSRAFGINNLGQVVGTSTSSSGTHAFLWTSSVGMLDLNALIPLDLGLVLSEAHRINDVGQIAALSGGGEQAPPPGDDHEQEHFYRVFLLTP